MNDIRTELQEYRSKGADIVLENLYAAKKELEQKIHIFNVFNAISSLKNMLDDFKISEVYSMCVMHHKYSNGDPLIDLILMNEKGTVFYEHDLEPLRGKVTSILNKIDRNLEFFHPLYLECSREYSFIVNSEGLDHLQEAFLNEDLDKIVSHALLHENLKNKKQKESYTLKI